jgi:hypothetical protein
MSEPIAERPYIAPPEYGVPKDVDGVLPWSEVRERLASARNYWICTASPGGSPHSRPTWGVWWTDHLCFGGGPKTRWSRNLESDPRVSVHLESGEQVAIIEGTVGRISQSDDPRLQEIDDLYEAKYEMRHGPPVWLLSPERVLAWNSFPRDMTRFRFGSAD